MFKDLTSLGVKLGWLANLVTIILGAVSIYSFKDKSEDMWIAIVITTILVIISTFITLIIKKKNKFTPDNKLKNKEEFNRMLTDLDYWDSAYKWFNNNKISLMNRAIEVLQEKRNHNQQKNYSIENKKDVEILRKNIFNHFEWISTSLNTSTVRIDIEPYSVSKHLSYEPYCIVFNSIYNDLKTNDKDKYHIEKDKIRMLIKIINNHYC